MASASLVNGRYRVLEELGRGGQGVVLKVADGDQAGRLKVLKAPLRAADEATLEHLRWEFVRLARLDHARLLRVYDLEVVEPGSDLLPAGQIFFTAEFCAGVHPAEWLARLGRRRQVELLWRIATDVASALDHLHARGLRHGDVKPENLLCTAEGDVKLLDLGLSTVLGALADDVVTGTLDHLAPEALAGVPDARSDLYALGSTLFTLAAGQLPRVVPPGADPAARIRALLEQDPPPLRSLADHLPEGLCTLVDALLARRPADRPRSAQVLLEQIGRRRRTLSLALADGGPGLPLLATGVVGHAALREDLRRVLAGRLAETADPAGTPAVLVLRGASGSGRRTVLAEVGRELQVAAASGMMPPFRLARGATLAEALAPVLGTPGTLAPDDGALLGLLDRLEQGVERRRLVVVVEDGERDRAVLEQLFTLVRRDPDLRLGHLAIAVRLGPDAALEAAGLALEREVPPLDGAEVAELLARALGSTPAADLTATFLAASQGLPERLHALLGAAWQAAGDRRRVGEVDLPGLSDASLVALATARVATLAPELVRLGLATAVAGAPLPLAWAAELADLDAPDAWAAVEQLTAEGLVCLEAGHLRPATRAAAEALLATAEGTPALAALHRRLAERYRPAAEVGDEVAEVARIRHLAAAPPSPELPALAEAAAARHAARSEWRRAAELLAMGVAAGPPEDRDRLALGLAEAHVRGGEYAAGLAPLEALAARAAPALRLRVATLRGLALQRLGELGAARALLEAALDDGPVVDAAPAGDRAEARAVLGRVRLAQGEVAAARALCPTVAEAPPGAAGLPLLELGGLAAYYAGALEEARAMFETAADRARGAENADRLARAVGCLGMVAQAEGDLGNAATHYAEAWQLAEARGDVHGGAHWAANLGAVHRDQGDLAAALSPSVAAVRRMVQLGHTAELPVAVYNLGNLLLTLGDLAGTARELTLLAAEAERTGTPLFQGYLRLLAAELQQRLAREGRPAPRELPRALRRRGSALALEAADRFAQAGAGREECYARIAALECLAAEGRPERATAARAALAERLETLDDPMARHWLALARARLVLAGGTDATLPVDLEAAREAFGASALPETAWRAELLAARIAQRAGDEAATRRHTEAAVALARAQHERLPEAYRAQRERDPDAVQLARLERSLSADGRAPDSVRVAGRAGAGEGDAHQLRRLLEINKRLNQELRLPILLELVLDAVLELTDGERGFILLMSDEDVLEVRIARNMDRRTLQAGEFSLSQSIAEQAARQGEPVLTVDAAMDERFASAVSVHGLRLRSVLAVPLRVKGRVVGTVYVDNRLRRGAFQEGDLALVQDFAEQAAIALENARLHEAVVAQGAEVAQLNEALAERLEHQEAQIAEMRTELRQSQAALQVRYDYSNIVGQTPKMLALFHLLDRITDVDLPVVIHGESGTGKELVARAIHVNGPRKDRPFVSENCGAVPETLLESILFGHVRGAFTGADRDRRGLFEVADGGTLFLDEVGEMSPGMQTKLLRVLQEGELRRVGGDQVIRVDVRILAASNQRLEDLVAERRFRQDLYYRLNVLSVTLPPLRDRVGDIPLLVDHFVRKHSAQRPRRIARPALERLMAYAWPGNVRELENELQRALALGGDVIGVEDLSALVSGARAPVLAPDDLDLRAHVELLERDLLERALERTHGNQTKAAQLLGLSRYGLLKKLRRYELLPSTGNEA